MNDLAGMVGLKEAGRDWKGLEGGGGSEGRRGQDFCSRDRGTLAEAFDVLPTEGGTEKRFNCSSVLRRIMPSVVGDGKGMGREG